MSLQERLREIARERFRGYESLATCSIEYKAADRLDELEAAVANRDVSLEQADELIDQHKARVIELEARLGVSPDHGFNGAACRDETIKLLEERVAALEAENAELRKDAERYRWLREDTHWPAAFQFWPTTRSGVPVRGAVLDTAIDTAIAKEKNPLDN